MPAWPISNGSRWTGRSLAWILGGIVLCGCAGQPAGERPGAPSGAGEFIRGVLVDVGELPDPEGAFRALKAGGFNAAVLSIDEQTPGAVLEQAQSAAAGAGLALYWWLNIGRNPGLADRHPEWIAGVGSHEDWRSRFPDAPRPGAGERIGAYPWTPIWYREVLEDRRKALIAFLRPPLQGIAGVFLNDVQGAPSACGCGNLQCRWTVDYGFPGGPVQVDAAPAALLTAALQEEFRGMPEVDWIPVLASECEEIDQREGGTGYCGSVHCFSGRCWKAFSKELEEVAGAARGPLGFLADGRGFGRNPPEPGPQEPFWAAAALGLLESVPASAGRHPVPKARFIAVVDGSPSSEIPAGGLPESREARLLEAMQKSGSRGCILSRIRLDESWEPRIIHRPGAPGRAAVHPPPEGPGAGH